MPRLKKITLDAVNSRAIESDKNPRVARKPVFYAGETVSVDVNPVELALQPDNTSVYETIRTAGVNTVGMRLGTTTTLVAQGAEFTYIPPARHQATLSVTTAAAVTLPLALETAQVPTTAMPLQVVEFVPARNQNISATLSGVTATFSAILDSRVLPAITVAAPLQDPDALRYPGFEIFIAGTCVTFSSTVNSPAAAAFTVTTVADAVTSIGISSGGSGYPNGTHNLTFTGGTVTTVAEATCVASGGSIISVTIVTGGSGYVTKPSASLFTPAKQITSIVPSITLAVVNDRPRFHWHRPLENGTAVTLSISAPTSTSTPVTAISPVVRMQYVSQDAEGMPVWEINVVSAGYGYVGAPAVSVPGHEVSARRRTTSASVSGDNLTVSVAFNETISATAEDGCLIPGSNPYHLALSGRWGGDSGNREDGPFDYGARGAELPAGTFSLQDADDTVDGQGKFLTLPNARAVLGRTYFGNGISTPAGLLRVIFDDNEMPAQKYRDLAGRSFICAVIPQRVDVGGTVTVHALNETAPERYAIARVSFRPYPGGFPDYYVAQNDRFNQGNGLASGDDGRLLKAPGGGFFEPTLEFLDYGKGYKTTQFVGTNAHQRYTYNLRVLSGLNSGHVIDETPAARSVTAITLGTLGADSFIQTAYSSRATVATTAGSSGIASYIDQPGFGYQQAGYFSLAAVTVPDALSRVQITNRPWGYSFGEHTCTVSGGGGTGAQVKMLVSRGVAISAGALPATRIYAVVVCAGSGYTSVPSIIPPAPNLTPSSGQVVVTKGGTINATVSNGVTNETQIIPSGWKKSTFGYDGTWIPSAYGYVCSPRGSYNSLRRSRVTFYTGYTSGSLARLTADEVGRLGSINGAYATGEEVYEYAVPSGAVLYPLSFTPSPEFGGTAEGFMVIEEGGRESNSNFYRPTPYFFVTKTGFGYVTAPAVSVQAPELSGFYIKSLKLASSAFAGASQYGAGYYNVATSGIPDTGEYAATGPFRNQPHQLVVSPQPKYDFFPADMQLRVQTLDFSEIIGKIQQKLPPFSSLNDADLKAERAKYEADNGRKMAFLMLNSSGVYASAPTVSTPTFGGFAITSVSVTCQGYFYEAATTTVLDNDPTGQGAKITVDEIKEGKISRVTLVNGGSGYSSTPSIDLSQPGFNPRDLPSEFGFKNNLSITVASASSVLGTSSSADAFLELYENEGANQHVITQVPVTLAKRVSST